jgi:hypothetical protein
VVGGGDGVDELVESLVDRGLAPAEDGVWVQEAEGAGGVFLDETQVTTMGRARMSVLHQENRCQTMEKKSKLDEASTVKEEQRTVSYRHRMLLDLTSPGYKVEKTVGLV